VSAENRSPLKRFLTDNPTPYQQAIEAAQSYVGKLAPGEVGWLYSKPFLAAGTDPATGHAQYFELMYGLLNLLQAMQLVPQSRILEIGCGPGWVTEILLMLGFSVDALEPSGDLIDVARARCASQAAHFHHGAPDRVQFHQSTLEEVEFEDQRFDAILFFDVLHHVVQEELAIKKCFAFLKPGGCVGITEGAWHPEFKVLEAALVEEMTRFGTLENPFSQEYLDHLLHETGFVDVARYASVNGLFSATQLALPMARFAAGSLAGSNHVTARKPSAEDVLFPSCTELDFKTDAAVRVSSGGIDPATRTAALVVEIKNMGETLLDNRVSRLGHITVALRQGAPGSASFAECQERHLLTTALAPGKSVQMKLSFTLPPTATEVAVWEIDLVAEGVFWLSSRGMGTSAVPRL